MNVFSEYIEYDAFLAPIWPRNTIVYETTIRKPLFVK